MDEYIKRKALLEAIDKAFDESPVEDTTAWMKGRRIVRTFPAADVEEVKHGAWINECILDDEWYHTCSNCNVEIRVTFFDFRCPNCGAKMDGEVSE